MRFYLAKWFRQSLITFFFFELYLSHPDSRGQLYAHGLEDLFHFFIKNINFLLLISIEKKTEQFCFLEFQLLIKKFHFFLNVNYLRFSLLILQIYIHNIYDFCVNYASFISCNCSIQEGIVFSSGSLCLDFYLNRFEEFFLAFVFKL